MEYQDRQLIAELNDPSSDKKAARTPQLELAHRAVHLQTQEDQRTGSHNIMINHM